MLRKNRKNTYQLKRQWGTEKNTTPLSHIHSTPSTMKIALSRVAIVLTVIFWMMYLSSIIIKQIFEGASYQFTLEAFGYATVVTFLTFSALMYLIARQGAFQRFLKHVRVPRALLDKHFAETQPTITVLVPSYAEEYSIIRKTLLSAAFQEYPDIKVVLLVDDNPNPKDPDVLAKLEKTRSIGKDIEALFSEPKARFKRALAYFEEESKRKDIVPIQTVQKLIAHYDWAANWLSDMANKETIEDHVDVFFVEQVLHELAKDLSLVKGALNNSLQEGVQLSQDRIHQLYRRLTWIFNAEVEVFERKKYLSLSHEANKAMNLNSYIGLMGGMYKNEVTPEGTILLPVNTKEEADLVVPDSEFLLTLDADSILLKEYCLRLVHFLQQPDNQDVAVTQTPYSSYRGAGSRIERLSGATTDIQHILHQGMTEYDATFWVGANAVIRKKALLDIEEQEWVGGFKVSRFIQDRTVIEDTESSIDLVGHGWRLINYPERLSYSATPPDFGSLIVQRRRWANGGLLILPKMFFQKGEKKTRFQNTSKIGILLRINYMASITWASFGLIFLLAYPYDGRLLSPLVTLAALPYFIAQAVDLKYCGYNYSDIFRIYGFNLILLPVNLAGVMKSIQQALTVKKIPFARTPKVKNRTAAGLLYVTFPLFIVAFSVVTFWRNIVGQNWGNAAFAGFNAVTAIWAIVAYIGVGNLFADIWYGLTDWMYVEYLPKSAKPAKKISKAHTSTPDWKVVLYHGEEKGIVPHTSLNDLVIDRTTERVAL